MIWATVYPHYSIIIIIIIVVVIIGVTSIMQSIWKGAVKIGCPLGEYLHFSDTQCRRLCDQNLHFFVQ